MKNTLRRITVISIFIVVFAIPLWAQAWETIGIGSTAKEAKENAYVNLIQMVSGVSVSDNASVLIRDDGKGDGQSIFRENSFITSYGYLLGVKDQYVNKENMVEAHVVLDESAIPLYKSKIEQLVKDIEAVYANRPTEDKTKKDRYLNLLNLLYLYENQRHIVSVLGADMSTISEINLNITYNSIQNEYMGYLIENENHYSKVLNEMNKFGTAEFMELSQKLLETRQTQAEIEDNAKRAQIEHDLMQKKRVEENMNRYVEHVILPSYASDLKDQEDFWVAFADILNEIRNFKMKYENMIRTEQERINNEIYITAESMRKMPYRISEQNNGKPILSAVLFRDLEIQKMANEKKADLVELISLIDEKMKPVLDEMYHRIEFMVKDFKDRSYLFTSDDVLMQASYDGLAKEWKINIICRVGTLHPSLSWNMSYYSVTGKQPMDTVSYSSVELANKIVSDSEFRNSYEEESQIVNSYTTIILSNKPNIFIDYHYEQSANGCFYIVLDTASIDFLDGNGSHEIDVSSIEITDNTKFVVDDWYDIINTSMFGHGNRKLPSSIAVAENKTAFSK